MSRAVFSSPFPATVGFAHVCGEGAVDYPLASEDCKLVPAGASEKRRKQFLLGRRAIREALAQIGVTSSDALGRAADGQALWPAGLTGTVAHHSDHAAAAVVPSAARLALGIDLESSYPRRGDIASRICVAEELKWLNLLPLEERGRTIIEIFSAKEAIYKALYPLHRKFFGFDAVTLTPATEGFDATLRFALTPPFERGTRFGVRLSRGDGLVFAAVALAY